MHGLSEVTMPRSPSSRRFWLGNWLLLLFILTAVYALLHLMAEKQLREALAETDQLDPSWRFEAILAQRSTIPDEENSALHIIVVKQMMPSHWPWWLHPLPPSGPDDNPKAIAHRREVLTEGFFKLPVATQLPPELVEALREQLDRLPSALAEARKLASMPRGRHPIVYQKEYLATSMPTLQEAQEVSELLGYAILLRIQDGDLEGALEDCRAVLNAGRSVGEEPRLYPQLLRLSCRATAVRRLERVLAHGQVSEQRLAAVQFQLEEDAEPLLLITLRGERGAGDGLFEEVQRGELPVSHLIGLMAFVPGRAPRLDIAQVYLPGATKALRAAFLRSMNGFVEMARLPSEQQARRMKALEESLASPPALVRGLYQDIGRLATAFWRSHADLRCAAVALAAERYRMQHGRWPESLRTLVPAHLKAVPLDPFDGAPLRFRRANEGLAVYALEQDGQDDGGDFRTLNANLAGSDRGFRLWNVEQRRQPPVPLRTEEQRED